MSPREARLIETAPRDGTPVRVLHGPLQWRPWRIGTKHCRGGSGLMISYCEPCAGSHRGCPGDPVGLRRLPGRRLACPIRRDEKVACLWP